MALKAGLLLLLLCIFLCNYQVISNEEETKQLDHKAHVLPAKEAPAIMKSHLHDHDNQSIDHDDKYYQLDEDLDHSHDSPKKAPPPPMKAPPPPMKDYDFPKKAPPPPTKDHDSNCDTLCEEYCKSHDSKKCYKKCKKCCEKSKCVPAPMNNDKDKCKTWDYATVDGKMTKCP